MDPITIALILAIAGGVGTWLNNDKKEKQQSAQNARDKETADAAYAKQRADNLADFDRTNAYNSPEEQMNRFRQAGLSPNLIYGKGAETTGAMIKGANINTPNHPVSQRDAPLASALQGFGQGINIAQTQQQTDNLNAQLALTKQQEIATAAQTAKTTAETATSKFQLAQSQQLNDLVIQRAMLENSNLGKTGTNIEANTGAALANTAFTIDSNTRAHAMAPLQRNASQAETAKTWAEINTERLKQAQIQLDNENNQWRRELMQKQIAQIQQATDTNKIEEALKTKELELAKKGIYKGDALYEREIMKMFNDLWRYVH